MSDKTKKIIWYIFALFIPIMIGCLAISCWSFDLYHSITWENIDEMALAVNFTIFGLTLIVWPFATGIWVFILNRLEVKEKEAKNGSKKK